MRDDGRPQRPASVARPLPKAIATVLAVRSRLTFAGEPHAGGSVVELGSRSHGDGLPDGANRRYRAMLVAFDRQLMALATRTERFLEGEPRDEGRWRCPKCGSWRPGKFRFCPVDGAPAPEHETQGGGPSKSPGQRPVPANGALTRHSDGGTGVSTASDRPSGKA